MRRTRHARADLRAIWIDGMAWSVMVGMGEHSIPACALAAGLSGVAAGLSSTVPMLIGAVLQLALAPLTARVRSLKRWVVLCCALQALAFVPLIVGSARGSLSGWLLYACAALYWTLGLAANPAWSTWVEAHVPRAVGFTYWARRTRWLHVFTILGLAGAGVLLELGSGARSPLLPFAWVFLGAALARAVSVGCLVGHREHDAHPPGMRSIGLASLAGRLVQRSDRARAGAWWSVRNAWSAFRATPFGALVAALLASQAALSFAQPYFVPYARGALGASWAETMGLLAAAVAGRFLTLPAWGRLARARSLSTLFLVGGAASVPATLFWSLSTDYLWLLGAQLFAGAAWGAFELATFLSFFDRIERAERTSLLAWFNLANAGAFAAGSLGGGAVLAALGSAPDAYRLVFVVGAGLRLAAFLLVVRAERSAGTSFLSRSAARASDPASVRSWEGT
jgi:hypothetical protein